MSATNDGGPAFPVDMTLRDWFASNETLAEWDDQEAVPSRTMCEELAGRKQPEGGWRDGNFVAMMEWEADWRARLKYIRADAMLAARNGGRT